LSTNQKLVGQFKLDNIPEIKHIFNAFCVYILPYSVNHTLEVLEKRNIDIAEKELRKRDMLQEIQNVSNLDNSIVDVFFTNFFDEKSNDVFIQSLQNRI
jgi:guanylate kinase